MKSEWGRKRKKLQYSFYLFVSLCSTYNSPWKERMREKERGVERETEGDILLDF